MVQHTCTFQHTYPTGCHRHGPTTITLLLVNPNPTMHSTTTMQQHQHQCICNQGQHRINQHHAQHEGIPHSRVVLLHQKPPQTTTATLQNPLKGRMESNPPPGTTVQPPHHIVQHMMMTTVVVVVMVVLQHSQQRALSMGGAAEALVG